jgi:hypothetical protein
MTWDGEEIGLCVSMSQSLYDKNRCVEFVNKHAHAASANGWLACACGEPAPLTHSLTHSHTHTHKHTTNAVESLSVCVCVCVCVCVHICYTSRIIRFYTSIE